MRYFIRHYVHWCYLSHCSTTGDASWVTDRKHAEAFPSVAAALRGLEYHPFYNLRPEVVEIVDENGWVVVKPKRKTWWQHLKGWWFK